MNSILKQYAKINEKQRINYAIQHKVLLNAKALQQGSYPSLSLETLLIVSLHDLQIEKKLNEESRINVIGNRIYVTEPDQIKFLNIYNLSGQKILTVYPVEDCNSVNIPGGIYVISYRDKKGNYSSKKVFTEIR